MSTGGSGSNPWLVRIVVICALVVTGLQVRREFYPSPTSSAMAEKREPVAIQGWEMLQKAGHWIGPTNARIVIVEFSDFECPVCRTFSTGALRAVRKRYPDDVAVVYRHWPLNYHRFALPAARAAECAADQGRFEAFHDTLWGIQDSLGLLAWHEVAKRAEVPNLKSFDACVGLSGPVPNVGPDTTAVMGLGGTGTPTVIINGWRMPGAPDSVRLFRFVDSALAVAGR